MNLKDSLLIAITVAIYGLITRWQPCLTTFCKSTKFPNWLNNIVYSVPIPFAEKFILAFIIMAPVIVFSESLWPVVTTILLSPLITVIVKYIPNWEATSNFSLSVVFDYAFVVVTLAIPSSLIFLARRIILH
jgi:hypothetical protein